MPTGPATEFAPGRRCRFRQPQPPASKRAKAVNKKLAVRSAPPHERASGPRRRVKPSLSGSLGTKQRSYNNQRVVIQTEGQSITPDQLGEAVLINQDRTSVRLKDVAHVLWAPAPAIGAALIQGKPGVIVQVSTQFGANAVQVTAGVDHALKDLRTVLASEGIILHPGLFRAASFVQTAAHRFFSAAFW